MSEQAKENPLVLFEEKKTNNLDVFKLEVRMAGFADGFFSPCYFDFEKQTLYRWKGVFLLREQMRYAGPQSRLLVLDAAKFKVLSIDVPVRYREVDGGYRPGYLHRSYRTFYEFKGIMLKKHQIFEKSQDGQPAIVGLNEFNEADITVLEVEMPPHLNERPIQWKK